MIANPHLDDKKVSCEGHTTPRISRTPLCFRENLRKIFRNPIFLKNSHAVLKE